MRRLAIEPVRLDQRAVVGRAALEPAGETVLVHEVDEAGILAAVGDEERCVIGHGPGSRSASGPSQSGARLVSAAAADTSRLRPSKNESLSCSAYSVSSRRSSSIIAASWASSSALSSAVQARSYHRSPSHSQLSQPAKPEGGG